MAANHKPHAVFQSQPEAGHARIGDGNLAALALLQKNRDHAAAAAHNVSISRATEPRLLRTGVGIGLHKNLFRAQLRRTVQVDRIHRLVGAESQNALYALVDGRVDHVAAAHDVGLNRFERIVFAGRNLLQRRRVDHHGNARRRRAAAGPDRARLR